MAPFPRFTLTLLIVASVSACADVDGPTPVVSDEPIGQLVTFDGVLTPGCPAAMPKTLLIDPTHDGGTWWYPQYSPVASGYKPDSAHQGLGLANYFRARGYTVTELGRFGKMAPDSMLKYSAVIRAGYYYDPNHPGYATADLNAYAAYVACPRTLIILADYLRDGRRDELADFFDIRLDSMITSTITSFTPHAITSGVTSINFIAGSYVSNETNPAIQVLGRLGTGHAVMGLLTNKAAKVFFIGDVNGIQGLPQPFLSNLFSWGF